MTDANESALTSADYADAMTEVSFLLDILASTVDELMGGATVSLGRIAGRHQARRLPIFIDSSTLEGAIATLDRTGNLGAQLNYRGADCTIEFNDCVIRAVCQQRKLELGGNLCRLYHFYIDGIINECLLRPTRSRILETGATCRTSLEVR